MPEPVRIFVSYASPNRPFAEKLVADLRAAGADVWWDVSGIDKGDFLDKINQALHQCVWLILVLTPKAVASKWVKREVNAAIHRVEQGFMRGIIPVLASPTEPKSIPPLWANLHRYDGAANYAGEVARLIRTLDLSRMPVESPRAEPAGPTEEAPAISFDPPTYFMPQLAALGFFGLLLSDGRELIGPPLCYVPAGPFIIGSDKRTDPQAQDNELPPYEVTLPAYYIAKYPVTVAEYACFVRSGYSAPDLWQRQLSKLDHPVVQVTWHDAVAHAKWRAEQTGQQWRLPTEAEWEKAARGTDRRIYPWGNEFEASRCNTRESAKNGTTPVGTYPSGEGPYGAQDMSGNVKEWTTSAYKPYQSGRQGDRARSKASRVLRGGSWRDTASRTRAACRNFDGEDSGVNYEGSGYGFRLARSALSP
jgi:formylglycine-generating enzyme required for sulfatase activity